MTFLMVGLGGLTGSISRFLAFQLFKNSGILPLHTVMVNLLGSFLIGIVLAFGLEKSGENWFLFLVPGFLGGFTTYSAFSADMLLLLKNQNYSEALFYFSLTFAGGLAATATGYLIGRFIFLKAL
ncbi:MAG: fluoride efflux transporter FluC [Bacteriovoracia bacterium]